MKASFDSKKIKKALSTASYSMQKNVVMPVLECVKLDFDGKDRMKVTTTNLKTTSEIELEALSDKKFSVLVLFQAFNQIVEKAVGPISLINEENQVVLSFDGNKSKLKKSAELKDFPTIEEDLFFMDVEIDGSVFHSITNANSCGSDDTTRPQMQNCAIHFKKKELVVVGCSAFGFFIQTFPIKCSREEIVQLRPDLIAITKQFQEATISIGDKFVRVKHKDITITSQRTELPYCSYGIALELGGKPVYNIAINRLDLMNAIEVAGISFTSKTAMITLSQEGSKIKIESRDDLFGKEDECYREAVFLSDKEIKPIRFNANIMLTALKALSGEIVQLGISEPQKPIYICQEEDESILTFLQPITI